MTPNNKRLLAIIAGLGATAVGSSLYHASGGLNLENKVDEKARTSIGVQVPSEYTSQNSSAIRPTKNETVREGPVYDESVVPSNYCSRYVRLAAKDMFGIDYPSDDAWKIRNHKGLKVTKIANPDDIYRLAQEGDIMMGDILCVYNPTSKYNGREDARKAGYTHVMLISGIGDQDIYLADKFGSKTRTKIGLKNIMAKGLKPIETIHKED